MTRFCYCLFCLVTLSIQLHAQHGRKEDVLHLKNQWIIRGTIINRRDSSISIRTQIGNVYVFTNDQVLAITKETPWAQQAAPGKGVGFFTELGPLIAGRTTIDGVTTAAFSFQTAGVYAFSRKFMPGIGAGADLYATQTILPFFATLRGDLMPTAEGPVPFYFADLGYGVNITQRSSAGADFRGGLLYAAGLGVKVPFNRRAGFLLSLGYRYQKTSYVQAGAGQEVLYRRLALRAGFYL